MRIAFYISGILFLLLATFFLAAAITNYVDNASFGYVVGTPMFAAGVVILYAARKNYKGGLLFLSGIVLCWLFITLTWGTLSHNHYQFGDKQLIGSVAISSFILMLGALLLGLGHRRHKNLHTEFDSPHTEIETLAADPPTPHNPIASGMPEAEPPVLYPPMQTWRIFLLLILSGTLYVVFLIHRAAKDLAALGEKQIRPRAYALAMLVPFYGFIVFLRLTKSIARLGKSKALQFKFKPSHLFWLALLSSALGMAMPTFLLPLTLAITSIPFLIMNRQMNRLRLAHADEWQQPANGFNWRQISVLVLGVPLTGLAIYGSKGEYRYFAADRLDIGQTVSSDPAVYRLVIPDSLWRQVPTGTLYPDTNLELVSKGLNEWVVVRVQPNPHQTLDGFVDQRREIVAADWKNYKVTETRTLNSGAELTPISLAYYTQSGGISANNQPIYVATVVTSEHAVEVIGQGSKNSGSTALELVKSFRLMAKENP